MNTVILCGYPNSPYARSILKALNAQGLTRINVVAGSGGGTGTKGGWGKYGLRFLLVLVRSALSRVKDGVLSCIRSRADASQTLEGEVVAQGGEFRCVQDVNGSEAQRAIETLGADLMILGGAPIVKAHILGVPRMGTLNAHLGALPRFRGMNVIEWALIEGDAPMITIHFVDPGVDTGDIVSMDRIPVKTNETLSSIREAVVGLQSALLARTAAQLAKGAIPRQTQRKEDGKQYYTMHPVLKVVAEARLQQHASGAAMQASVG